MTGKVVSLYIARATRSPMVSLETAHLVPGRGIEGDRFYSLNALQSEKKAYEVTLIEQEAIEDFQRSHPGNETGGSGRRNIVVQGCALHTLDTRTFRIGEVLLRGTAPQYTACHSPVEEQQGVCDNVRQRWIGAEILTDGHIHVGDVLEELPSVTSAQAQSVARREEYV